MLPEWEWTSVVSGPHGAQSPPQHCSKNCEAHAIPRWRGGEGFWSLVAHLSPWILAWGCCSFGDLTPFWASSPAGKCLWGLDAVCHLEVDPSGVNSEEHAKWEQRDTSPRRWGWVTSGYTDTRLSTEGQWELTMNILSSERHIRGTVGVLGGRAVHRSGVFWAGP